MVDKIKELEEKVADLSKKERDFETLKKQAKQQGECLIHFSSVLYCPDCFKPNYTRRWLQPKNTIDLLIASMLWKRRNPVAPLSTAKTSKSRCWKFAHLLVFCFRFLSIYAMGALMMKIL